MLLPLFGFENYIRQNISWCHLNIWDGNIYAIVFFKKETFKLCCKILEH